MSDDDLQGGAHQDNHCRDSFSAAPLLAVLDNRMAVLMVAPGMHVHKVTQAVLLIVPHERLATIADTIIRRLFMLVDPQL